MEMTARRRWLAVPAILAGLVLATVVAPQPASAATTVEFGSPGAEVQFGSGITFTQPATLPADVTGVEILLGFPGSTGPLVVEVPRPTGTGAVTLRHAYEAQPGDLAPNTRVEARWRVTLADGTEAVGPLVAAVYADNRFAWRTRSDGLVRLHWYEGDDAFARKALQVAVDGLEHAEALLGVTESQPLDFYVYATEADIYAALAPDRENVGGQAYPAIRTLFGLITPGEVDDPWVGVVIPHEITHLVFDTAVASDYGYPPKWLNEGIAVYLSEGYTASHRAAVEQAVDDRSLIPLDGLVGQFPTSFEHFSLAYSESVSAVDYLTRTHGEPALTKLIEAYGRGLGDEEAFTAAIGSTPAVFDAAWRAELGAVDPVVHGPRPGEPGPVPDAWGAVATPGASTAPATPTQPSPGLPGQGIALVLASAALALAITGGLVLHHRRRPGGTVA
jgi:hypothetical protein